jgi:hypothetical protein
LFTHVKSLVAERADHLEGEHGDVVIVANSSKPLFDKGSRLRHFAPINGMGAPVRCKEMEQRHQHGPAVLVLASRQSAGSEPAQFEGA